MPRHFSFALLLAAGLGALSAGRAGAQVAPVPAGTPSPAPADSLDFGEFGDADDKKVRTFATQKVLFLSPTKLISVGYEGQADFDLTSTGPHFDRPRTGPDPIPVVETTRPVNRFGGLRLGVNAPVISRSSFILNLGLTYWNTDVRLDNPEQSALFGALRRGLRSTGVNATVFKPFDNKHFLLLQANADLNGIYRNLDDISSEALTFSGTAIYGWKPTDNYMWGLGLTRTYRAGQLLHIPVVFYNRTFSPRWGVEAVFPARVNLRRSFGTSSLLMLGYEIEGNAYYLGPVNGQDLYLRRGELKPRITYERQLAGFVWLSAQVGYRYNWRFNAFATQNPEGDDNPVFDNTLGNPLYFNVSVNLVSP
ncbi:DUF6268 family outer membrane beta-barrel protein [Hymenobacter weizhouensis]|uniref:DUF6268 family outer membrane beta-barrel protein n=1 Tax=Hymenobacter sp. YIM 151500-1 TaxID=2987689 RepID=UPI002227B524|nr:DUF6268 family outer membrane beta-barrel protein [Hymenobacter sp. YIM 151500-1]UYZ61457.1 DUF6268 family outer membrane beta-barrel protein [Hymenobacter sp. YIM 151500-1]